MAHSLAWSEANTTIGSVLEGLEAIRRTNDRRATQTSVATLVVVAADQTAVEQAKAALHEIPGQPGRTIFLLLGDERGLQASVDMHSREVAGHLVWSEYITLHVGGPAAEHLVSVVEPLVFSDLPVAVWYVGLLPEPDDRLALLGDTVLIDTRHVPHPDPVGAAARLAAEIPALSDLAWLRLGPWRQLTAALFEPVAWRPFAHRITTATVWGSETTRRLLAGWLRSRITLDEAEVQLVSRQHAGLELKAGESAVFAVERIKGERQLSGRARVEGGPSCSNVVHLPPAGLAGPLALALMEMEPDALYRSALQPIAP